MVLILALIFWVICGVLAYGFNLADFQTRWPYLRDFNDVLGSIVVGLGGPIGLLVVLTHDSYKHGLQFWPKPPEEPHQNISKYLGE